MDDIALIFPDQLFDRHPALTAADRCFLIEDPLFFGTDTRWPLAVHKQRLILHRASMQAYAEMLKERGVDVRVIEFHQASSPDTWLPHSVERIHIADPLDDLLGKRTRRLAKQWGTELVIHESPGWISPDSFVATEIRDRKRPFMANFYQRQRCRMQLMVEADNSPLGGKWSFDADNRAKLPKGYCPPPEPRVATNRHVAEAMKYVGKHFPKNPGSADTFRWPVTHQDALVWLDRFLHERFHDFGVYEDAISTRHGFINHSAISPALNIGLLEPAIVVKRVMEFSERLGNIPLNSVEGFIRQIIGWREFIAGIYRHRGVAIRNSNFWGHQRSMPEAFYTAETGIPPVDRVIRQVLRDGWCHHIERLMILGNFMLLCRIHPHDVYRWFMELFVDAYDWVMVPNIYGMSQFADGGTFTTKPYLSGSNYVIKMSDEVKGPWCRVWDGLFWSFIADNSEFFIRNPRLSMMVHSWNKMGAEKQNMHRAAADSYLDQLS